MHRVAGMSAVMMGYCARMYGSEWNTKGGRRLEKFSIQLLWQFLNPQPDHCQFKGLIFSEYKGFQSKGRKLGHPPSTPRLPKVCAEPRLGLR